MKVKCDSTYASYLRTRYFGRLTVAWDNGLMTVAQLVMDFAGICEE